MNWHRIVIVSQDGKFDLDEKACADEPVLREAVAELFFQHGEPSYRGEPMFRVKDGILQAYDGGWEQS